MPARPFTRIVLGWLALLLVLSPAAWGWRISDLSQLQRTVVRELQPYAELGRGGFEDYIYGQWNSPGLTGLDASPQGAAVYLLNQGHASPALLRTLLLCEARRIHPERYLDGHEINSDLRAALCPRCLSAYPADPLVNWAAGVLKLNGGDFAGASDALELALKLADGQGGAADYFARHGIEPRHVHGRLGTALMMTGRMDEGREQLAQAELNPGTVMPPNECYRYSDEFGFTDSLSGFEPLRSQMQQAIDDYLATGDEALLLPLHLAQEDISLRPPSDEFDYEKSEELLAVSEALLKAYILSADWERLGRQLEQVEASHPSSDWYYRRTSRQAMATLLLRVAHGERAGTGPEEYAQQQRQGVIDYHAAQETEPDEWELRDLEHGEFAAEFATCVPGLLESHCFAQAVESGGRPLAAVLAELADALQPLRENYRDNSNGALRWPRGASHDGPDGRQRL